MKRADNELLTRVGPGTPMGDLMRQYWIPALLGAELPAPDAPPVRVRLLGEDLVAFRDSAGEVGILSERCPHRCASLALGRNEGGGLRCVYHGWKFDRTGRCTDMPNEPRERRFEHKVRARALACAERGGVLWAYLGPRATPPPLPDFEWNLASESPPFLWRSRRECNWLQALEGDIDSSHLGVLHATLDDPRAPTVPGRGMPGAWSEGMQLARGAGPPRIEALDTPYGALYSAWRELDEQRDYHRVHPFLFPFHTMVGGGVEGGSESAAISMNGKAWVPMDDEHTQILEWQWRPGQAWSAAELEALRAVRMPWGFLPPDGTAAGHLRSRAHAGNEFLRDRELERSKLFFGVLSNPLQDAAVQESMGAIVDRSQEQLGPADAMIARVRQRLLAAARALRERGELPPGVDQPELFRVRPVGAILPRGADWLAATRARREAAQRPLGARASSAG